MNISIKMKNLFKKLKRGHLFIFKKTSSLFCDAPFYIQGQMDIHPKSAWFEQNFVNQTGGFFVNSDFVKRKIINLDPWDNTRRDMIVLFLRHIVENKIQGDLAEVGVYKGATAKLIHHYMPEKLFHLFDTFEGFTDKGREKELQNTGHQTEANQFADVSMDDVRKNIYPQNSNVVLYKGYFPESAPDIIYGKKFSFVHLDADLYDPIKSGLDFFYPRMAKNGIILVHDYNAWPGARKAVDEFFINRAEMPIPMPDKSGSAVIVKL